MPEECLGHRVVRPVRILEVGEDDAGLAIAVWRVAPDVEVTMHGAWARHSRPLEPRMLVGGMGQDQLGDDAHTEAMRFPQEGSEVTEGAVRGMDVPVVRDVV